MNDMLKHKISLTKLQDIHTTKKIVHNNNEYIVKGTYSCGTLNHIVITKHSGDTNTEQSYMIKMVYVNDGEVEVFTDVTKIINGYTNGVYTNNTGKLVFRELNNVAVIDDAVALQYDTTTGQIIWVCADTELVEEDQPSQHTLDITKLVHTSLYANPRTPDYVFRKLVEESGEIAKALNQPERCYEPVKVEIADLVISALDLLLVHEIQEEPSITVNDVLGDFQEILNSKISKWAKQQGLE